MPNKKIKLKFNNFKPFGENYQEISIRPITLIYGPNSAGKSSLIDALLYYENLQLAHIEELGDPGYLNVENKYFAGDKVDLGGFKNFVHQKDTSRTINYVTTYTDRKDFKKFIPDFKIIEKAIGDFLNEHEDDYWDNNLEFIENKLLQRDKDKTTEEKQENDSLDVIIELYEDFIDDSIPRKNILSVFNNARKRLKKSKNSNENIDYEKKVDCIYNYITFCIDIMSITSIKIKYEVICDDQGKLYTVLFFYIDDKVVFNVRFGKYKTYYEVYNHNIFKHLIEIDKNQNNVIQFNENHTFKFDMFIYPSPFIFHNLRHSDNYLETMVLNIMYQIQKNKNIKAIQYIGPLRLIPTKDDLFQNQTDQTSDYKRLQRKNLYSNFNDLGSLIFYKIFGKDHKNMIKVSNFFKSIDDRYNKIIKNKNIILKFLINLILLIPSVIFTLVFLLLILLLVLPLLIIWRHGYNLYILFQKKINKFKNIFLNDVSLSTLGAVTSEKMWADFVSSKKIQKKINLWLGSEKMKTQYSIHIEDKKVSWFGELFSKKEKKQLSFMDKKNNTIVFPNEMGTGISQVLPILISSLTRKKSSIFIEQPELHLHPALQSELADEFISSIKKQKNEFIIETHSEHLLLRMMKRMRQTSEGTLENKKMSLKPEDINLLYVDTHEGETFILELELDEDGTLLDPWPGGFFDEGFNERFF